MLTVFANFIIWVLGSIEAAQGLFISLEVALARMPDAHQRMIFETRKEDDPTRYLYEGMADTLGKRMAKIDTITCTMGAHSGMTCSNRERMYKLACSKLTYYPIDCTKCCNKCPELGTCKYACKLLEGKIKNIKASRKVIRANEQREKENRERPDVELVMSLWNRFGEARNAAGKTVKQCYEVAKMMYTSSDEQKQVVMECLEGKYTPDTPLPYGYGWHLYSAKQFIRMADFFGCSVDYLLCRTNIPQMATAARSLPEGQLVFAGWMPGGTTPMEPCDVVAKFDLGNGKLHAMLCRWDGKAFVLRASGQGTAMEPIKWMALPPDEEESV